MGINFLDTGLGETSRQIEKTYISYGTFSAGQLVKLYSGATDGDRCITVEAGTANGLCVGVALDASTASGQRVRVAVKGYVEDVLTDDSLVLGSAFCCSAAALATVYAGTEAFIPVGVALENDAGAGPYTCDVYLFGLFA